MQTVGPAKAILVTYLLCSVLLSSSILVRLLFTVDTVFKIFNIVMYWGLFLIIPFSAVIWLLYETLRRKSSAARFLFLCIFLPTLVTFAFFAPSLHGYLLLWFPVSLMIVLSAKWKDPASGLFRKRAAAIFASGLVIAILLPNVAAFVGVNSLLNQTTLMSNDREKASFISRRVVETTAFGEVPRADQDCWGFLLSGAGRCGEMAIEGTNLMRAAGLTARRVVLPGEDHTFIEVKLDGDWLVADPGYYGAELTTRTKRAANRIKEVGSVSYVVAYTENAFIELTQQYVSTDTIKIKITGNGEPLANAEIVLRHRFGGLTTQLPCNDRTFHTDVNGTVTLHMGKSHYVNEFKGSEEYYWIYVNSQNTGHNVTSTGTGQIQFVEIDLG
jgi:hypothetical protein